MFGKTRSALDNDAYWYGQYPLPLILPYKFEHLNDYNIQKENLEQYKNRNQDLDKYRSSLTSSLSQADSSYDFKGFENELEQLKSNKVFFKNIPKPRVAPSANNLFKQIKSQENLDIIVQDDKMDLNINKNIQIGKFKI